MPCLARFLRKGNKNHFYHKPSKPPRIHTNIKSLKDNPSICDNYSKRLDTLLAKEPNINDINNFEKSFTESIRQASEADIPNTTSSSKKYPWTNNEFVSILVQRKDHNSRRELNATIMKMRTKLKNDYFLQLANNINTVN